MRPIFTLHAGEYLVGDYLEKRFKDCRVWLPSKDTGVDLLVTDKENRKSVSLQVKFSKDFMRFDRRRRAVVSEEDQSVRLRCLLPSGATITPMVPSLADVDPESLSEDEQLLARYLPVVLPSGTDPTDLVAALRDLDGLEMVSTPPRIRLP